MPPLDAPFMAMPAPDETSEGKEEFEGREVEVRAPERPSLTPEEQLGNLLRKSETWGDEPQVSDQEYTYEDTFYIKEVVTKVFDLCDDDQAKQFSALELSDMRRGGKVFGRPPDIRFHEASGKYTVLAVVYVRKFKRIEPEKEEPEKKKSDE